MTKRDELLALAARVEAATGPDRELDAAIYSTTSEAIDFQRIGVRLSDASRLDRWHDGWVTVRGDKGEADPYPEDLKRYTKSIDAAETLVPAGADSGGERYCLEQWDYNGVHPAHVRASAWVAGAARVYAATPAQALTAAALRALASQEPDDAE